MSSSSRLQSSFWRNALPDYVLPDFLRYRLLTTESNSSATNSSATSAAAHSPQATMPQHRGEVSRHIKVNTEQQNRKFVSNEIRYEPITSLT